MNDPTPPYRSSLPVSHDGFAPLVRSEWTKFRTVRGWRIGVVGAALLMVLISLLAGSTGSRICINGKCRTLRTTVPIGPGDVAVTDSFFFAHRPLVGNGTITVRATSMTGVASGDAGSAADGPVTGGRRDLEPWAKAGIIIKASTTPGSAYAAIMVTGTHGVRMQFDFTHDAAGPAGAVSTASPRWLRLTRVGATITGYESVDGSHWNIVGTARLAGFPATAQSGLFVASPPHMQVSNHFGGSTGQNLQTIATATFDHVTLQGHAPARAWSADSIGTSRRRGPAPVGAFKQVGGTLTVSGSGDIAPDVARGVPIEHSLAGAFAALIVLLVLATMFVTAEYRRGLIRTTLAASPRRGSVVAAKAVVIGAVTFVAGLVAAAVSLAVGNPILRAHGNFLYPVSALTEVRVVAGTAALLAVAAVLALALGTIVRRSAAGVAAAIVVIVLPYLLAVASVLPTGPAQWLLRLTPAAAFAVQQSLPRYSQVAFNYTPSNGFFPLAPVAGFAVLCAYTAVAMGAAVWLLRTRDA